MNTVTLPDTSTAGARRASAWPWLVLAAVLIALDQLSKHWFVLHLSYGERRPVLPFFDLTLLTNPGAAFSFLAGGDGWQRWLLVAIAAGAIGLMLFLLQRHAAQRRFCLALALIMAGAAGNLIDRLRHGEVIDFLLFYWNNWHFPAFNVADMAITGGALVLILDELCRLRRRPPTD